MMTRKDFLTYKRYYEKGDKYLKRQAIEYFAENLKPRIELLKDYKKYSLMYLDDIVIKEIVKNLQEEVNYMENVLMTGGNHE